MADVMWTVAHDAITGAERCRLDTHDHGWQLSGSVVARHDGRLLDVHYQVELTRDWHTRVVDVTLDRLGEPRTLRLERDADATWTIDGDHAPDLDGCTDVDLGVTPSTNTLPIRRLGLEVGAERDIEVAWVLFPDLRVERGRQTYARLADDVWRYSSGSFTAELTVDPDGLVVGYGNDLWQRVGP